MSSPSSASPAIRKDSTYIWVTWLTSLLAGSSSCQWAAWFQANHKFDKQESDMSEYRIKHGRLLDRRVEELKAEGYKVYVEDENSFKIVGQDNKTATVAGKADIVAIKGEQVIVEDCKTGKKKDADLIQVLAYMMLLPLRGGPSHCRGKTLRGRLIYGEEIIDVPSSLLDQDFKDSFRKMVEISSGKQTARKSPSERECKYCKISRDYCPERVEPMEYSEEEADHGLF